MRRLGRLVLLLVVVLLGVGVAAGFWSARTPPAWFKPPAPTEASRERGWTVERRLAEEFSRIRAEQPTWSLRVREEDLNLWLAERLRPWVEHRGAWPESVGRVQVRLAKGRVSLAVELTDLDSVAVLEATPVASKEDGSVTLRWTSAGFGRLRLPWPDARVRGAVLDRVTGGREDLAAFAEVLEGLTIPGAIDLGDGRRVSLLDAEVGEGEAILDLVTAPAD